MKRIYLLAVIGILSISIVLTANAAPEPAPKYPPALGLKNARKVVRSSLQRYKKVMKSIKWVAPIRPNGGIPMKKLYKILCIALLVVPSVVHAIDESKIPHYYGPYPNWALSQLPVVTQAPVQYPPPPPVQLMLHAQWEKPAWASLPQEASRNFKIRCRACAIPPFPEVAQQPK